MDEKVIEKFKTKSDDGRIFELYVYQEYTEDQRSGKILITHTVKRIETKDGLKVRYEGDGTYFINDGQDGIIVKKI